MQAEYDCAGSARTGITRSHKVKAACVDWTHQKSIIRFDLVIYLLRSVFFFLQHVPFPHVKHELAWARVSTFVCSKYVMYALNLWEPCHGCGWCLFPCWRFMIFFSPQAIWCVFSSLIRGQRGTGVQQMIEMGVEYASVRAHTLTHAHANTHRHEGNRWKRPRYVASAGARPGGQAPLASLGVHWYLMFWQTLKCMFECRQCRSTLLGKVKPVWELLHKCPSLVDGKCKSSFIANYRTPHLLWKYSLAFLTEIKYTSF